MESLVYDGYMGAGDSMVMPNPISAGGIGFLGFHTKHICKIKRI